MELNEDEIKELKEKLESGDIDTEALATYRDGSVSNDAETIKASVGVINIYVELSTGKRVVYQGFGAEHELSGDAEE